MASQVENIKWVPGTKFIVDGFVFASPQCQHYFLTHCHSDHTVGLVRNFTAGTIWCSPISARLLAAERNMHAPTVRQLQLHQPVDIEGVTVTALDANHCPGAIMLLFEVPTGQGGVRRILHTGDCRWQDSLYTSSCLAHKRIDTLMLDTTYALPRHTFPPQDEAVSMMAQLMREALQEEPNTLLVVSSYHIGKERAYLGAAAALGLKVYVPPAKLRVLQLLDLPARLMSVVSTDPCSQVHVGCTSLVPEELQAYLDKQQQLDHRSWARIMGFRATGWAYRRSGGLHVSRPSSAVALVGVPYSEHSSWSDLRACVARLRPKRLIPTVNAATRSEQQALVDSFADLMDLSQDRGRMDAYLVRPAPAAARHAEADPGEAQPAACIAAAGPGMDAATAAGCGGCHAAAAVSPSPPAAAIAAAAAAAEDCSGVPAEPSGTGSAAGSHRGASAAPTAAGWQTEVPGCEELLGPTASVGSPGLASGTRASSGISSSTAWDELPEPAPGASPCDTQQQQQQQQLLGPAASPTQAAASAEQEQQAFDFGSVDVSEQQRLLADAERRQRLRQSLQLQAANKAKRQRATHNSSSSSRGGRLGPSAAGVAKPARARRAS